MHDSYKYSDFFCLLQAILLQSYRMQLGLLYDKVNTALLNSILYTKLLSSSNCTYMYNWLLKANLTENAVHLHYKNQSVNAVEGIVKIIWNTLIHCRQNAEKYYKKHCSYQ